MDSKSRVKVGLEATDQAERFTADGELNEEVLEAWLSEGLDGRLEPLYP